MAYAGLGAWLGAWRHNLISNAEVTSTATSFRRTSHLQPKGFPNVHADNDIAIILLDKPSNKAAIKLPQFRGEPPATAISPAAPLYSGHQPVAMHCAERSGCCRTVTQNAGLNI